MSAQFPVASSAVQRKVKLRPAAPSAELDALTARAQAEGFQLEGMALLRALADAAAIAKLERLLFNADALKRLRVRTQRIEFITEGPLPPALLLEPAAKSETLYTQTVDYALCKGCRLCIQVCPKRVYRDDGFGKPDELRMEQECTGNAQCGQCVYICPERAITMAIVNPLRESTLFVLLDNPYARVDAETAEISDFEVPNPLAVGEPLRLEANYDPDDLAAANRALEASHFYPVLELMGSNRHFVDTRNPESSLQQWARENARSPEWVLRAVRTLYAALPAVSGLKQGKYAFDPLIHRIIDDMLYADIDAASPAGRTQLAQMLTECYVVESTMGSKLRPIGGLLPPATSVAWKTPYGNEVPVFTRLEKCLGPECALCINHCPEGNGGEVSAIRMAPLVPMGTIASLVRGLRAHLLKLDGTHASIDDAEDLFGKQAFAFKVDPDFCKACGICIACCPHDVIDATPRVFDIGGKA